MNIRDILENSIMTALLDLKIDSLVIPNINLEHPEDISNGDYSVNVAMILSKKLARNPRELAENIVTEINRNLPKEIQKVEVAGPGFINFYLSKEFFEKKVKEIISEKDNFGKNKKLNNQKTIIEYTDPNPFKEFHIGHLMANAIGESISRIIESNGADVIRACYQGDVGLHVAKTIWGVKKMIEENHQIKKGFLGNIFGLGKDDTLWGKAYAYGAENYEGNEIAKKEIVEINKKVYEKNDSEVNKIYKIGRKVSLDKFEKIYKILGTKFNEYFFESQTTDFGRKIVEENLKKSIFEKSEGAVIFRGENYGLHTRVFINSEGITTYEAKDLGLAKIKHDRCPYEKSIIVTANEQSDYFKVLLKALELIYSDLAKKTIHVSHGMLRLPSGKMSSRTGKVITGEFLLGEIKKLVLEKVKDREMTEEEKNKVADQVSVGALKYSILKQTTGKDIIFDFDKSLSFEGDSGPYLQYSYARARSILKKAEVENVKPSFENNSEINELEEMLYRFSEVVERAGDEYSPHHIASYLIELSSTFNSFYAKGKIVDKESADSPYKVALTESFSIILKNGLNLLGIFAPEKM
ncbi:MAG: arginine--tRNA ligase [Candidatus Pacebacteria bacterium]|nr:arginine--tRNA ligase [Candidatus Paceibacterota bacterium]